MVEENAKLYAGPPSDLALAQVADNHERMGALKGELVDAWLEILHAADQLLTVLEPHLKLAEAALSFKQTATQAVAMAPKFEPIQMEDT